MTSRNGGRGAEAVQSAPVAVVTGAARGLGRGIAARLVADGWCVALVDVDRSVLQTATELAPPGRWEFPGGPALGLVADIRDEEACLDCVDAALDRFGRLDALVNNAGIGGPSSPVHLTDPVEFREVLEVNLVGAFLMSRAAVPAVLRCGRGGSVVNITSVLGQRGEEGSGAYSASKAGLGLISQAMAVELAPHGIRVNCVAPGNMMTTMHREHVENLAASAGIGYGVALDAVRALVPLGRHGTAEDVAGAVAWLLSDDSSYVTGQTVAVNGGILLT